MDVILGVEFFQNNSAVLDYVHKRLSLCNGLIRVPLLTHIDFSRVVRAIRRVRILAHREAILSVRLHNTQLTFGITETLPRTLDRTGGCELLTFWSIVISVPPFVGWPTQPTDQYFGLKAMRSSGRGHD